MSIVYNGEHSITIGSEHTWKNWHLIPTSRPLVNPPKMNVKYVEVPGLNGSIDLTTSLTSYPSYSNRTGSWEFIVANGYWKSWAEAYTTIMRRLNTGRKYIILDDDKGFRYTGRVSVNSWKSDKDWSKIVLDYNVGPFKHELTSTTDKWLWDPFSFVDGIIQPEVNNLSISGNTTIKIYGRSEPIVPVITVNSGSNITLILNNGDIHYLVSGKNVIPGMILNYGENTLAFSGTGNITIDYRAGEF